MAYEDRITITTPEGVELDMTLAGLGSRAIASILDSVIKLLLSAAVLFGLAGVAIGSGGLVDGGSALGVAVAVLFVFLVNFGYDLAFETLGTGRTPGKRWTGLRVVMADGAPVGLAASAVRNMVRIVDWLPFSYAIGTITVLFSRHNQRLGDIAAGTVVIRERRAGHGGGRRRHEREGERQLEWARPAPRTADESVLTWDVSGITERETAAVRAFLARRHEIDADARARIARDFAARLRPKVAGAPDLLHSEAFLEQLVAARSART